MNSVTSSLYNGPLDIAAIREQFPLLTNTTINGKPLVYFDNGATTQKPRRVIEAIEEYYLKHNSNIHRGVHFLSQHATDAYEVTRKKVQAFINSRHDHEIIFTKGTTDGINLLAYSFGKQYIQPGDEILISAMEHHSNIVPWQIMSEDRGAIIKVIPMNDKGELIMEAFYELLSPRTRLVAVSYISNSLGTVNPVKEIISAAHKAGAKVMLDAAQAIHHIPVDVQALDVDFLVFSSHKMYGPTGVGILYGKEALLNEMPPYQGGGDMIKTVTFEKTIYNELPFKFEAGTPNIEAGICLGAAIDFIEELGIEAIANYEHWLLEYATAQLRTIDGVRIIGEAKEKSGVLSFIIEGIHPYDIGVLLDKMGIAVRTGHHCTEPVMNFFNIPGTVRASFAVYNTKEEVDRFIEAVKKAVMMLL